MKRKRIDGVFVGKPLEEEMRERAEKRGLPYRAYVRDLLRLGAKEAGLENVE